MAHKSDWGLSALLLELHMNHMRRGGRVNKTDQLQMASSVQIESSDFVSVVWLVYLITPWI